MKSYNLKPTTCLPARQAYNLKGFTLIEIVVTISIVTVGFFAVVNIFPFSLRINKTSQNLTTATYLAQAGTEQALSNSYDDLGTGTIETKAKLSNNENSYLYYFERQTVVEYVDGSLNTSVNDTGMKKIETTIYWYNPMSFAEQSYMLSTLTSQK